jgi:hypothetical protein
METLAEHPAAVAVASAAATVGVQLALAGVRHLVRAPAPAPARLPAARVTVVGYDEHEVRVRAVTPLPPW